MEQLLQDIRIAARSLARQRGFTFVVVVTLALGTGATTAIFSVVNAILLRPLPYQESENVVMLWQTPRDNPGPNIGGTVSHVNYLDWKREARSFEAMALFSRASFVVSDPGEAELVPGAIVTPDFFRVFRAAPILGREFTREEDLPAGPDVVVVSHGFWQDRLGSRRDVVGSTIEITGRRRQIVGVAPPGFDFPGGARLWAPVRNNDEDCGRGCIYLNGVARLASAASVDSAREEMRAIATSLEEQFPESNTNVTVAVTTLHDQLVGDVRPALLILLAAVVMVLLIACANVASLMLVRGKAREAEVAVRAALGAARGRLLSHLVGENLVLGVAGAGAGLALAAWGIDLLRLVAPPEIPRLDQVALDGRTFAFAAGLAGLTTLLFGLGPALEVARTPVGRLLGTRAEPAEARRQRGRSLLLAAEVGLSLVLLVAAGLLLRSVSRLQAVDPGFRASEITVFTLGLPPAAYPDDADVIRTFEQLAERLPALAGVQAVGRINGLPLGPSEDVLTFQRPDQPPPPPGRAPIALFRVVDDDYFGVLEIRLFAGRFFDGRDRAGAQPAVIISHTMAERFWPGENAVGRPIEIGNGTSGIVVGIVGDVRSQSLAARPAPEMYVAHTQQAARRATFVLRSALPPGQLLTAAREIVRATDPKLPLIQPGTLQELVDRQAARPRFYLLLLALFATLAVVLAAVGVYGVVAYAVAQRTREIGLRIALGARARDVLRLVLWQGLRPAIGGTAMGVAGALVATRVMAGLLFETPSGDPGTLAAVTALLLLVVLLACAIPARRATRVAPADALRAE